MPTSFWHPFADMSSVSEQRFTVERGEGVYIWDDRGRRYIDAAASLWYANIGHGRPEIGAAIARQAAHLSAYSTFGDISNRPAEELADFIATRSPLEASKVFFTTGGGEAIDTAAKIARRYWSVSGRPEKTHIIHRENSYHGTNGFGTSLSGIPANRVGFGELIGGVSEVPSNDAEALESAIISAGAGNVAAFFAEPVIGAGGVIPPTPGYFAAVAAICERHDILLVIDSVICGFGRLGTWLGSERLGIRPDLITFAKGVTSGYLPLGGVVVSAKVSEPFFAPGGPVLRHGSTYAGHPLACAAGLANVAILEDEGLIERGEFLERPLLDALEPCGRSPLVHEVRGGFGLLAAVAFDADFLQRRPNAPALYCSAIRDEGVLARALVSSVAVSPPLCVTTPEIDQISEAMLRALKTLETISD